MAWWRRSRLVVCCALLAAIVGVAAWAAVDRLGELATIALRRSAAGGALPAVVVSNPAGIDAALVRQLLEPPVRAVLPRQFGVARLRGSEQELPVVVLGMALASEAMARPRRLGVATAAPAPGHARLLLDAVTASRLAVVTGDAVQLVGERETVAATVIAVLDTAGAEYVFSGVAIVELEAARRVLERSSLDQLELLLDPDRAPVEQAARLRRQLGGEFAVAAVERRTDPGASEALRTTWRMGSLLALVFALVALAAAIADQVRASLRRRELLRTIGASPAMRNALVALPAAGFALVAVFCGVLLGDLAVPWLRAGSEAWIELQTGIAVRLEVVPRSPLTWLLLLLTTAVASIAWALVCDRRRPQQRPPTGRSSVRLRRLASAASVFALVLLLAHSEAVQASRWLRVLDLVLGIVAVAFTAPPLVACFARWSGCDGRGGTESAVRLLAIARIRERPGSLLQATRLAAITIAIVTALLCIVTSLRTASPAIVHGRVPGDLVATSVTSWLGVGSSGDKDALQQALRASPKVLSVEPMLRPATFAVALVGEHLLDPADVRRVAHDLLPGLPLGSVLADAAATRERLLRATVPALGTIETMVWLLAIAGALAVVLLWWLDDLHDGRTVRLLRTVGGGTRHRLRARLWLALWCGAAAAAAGVAGGTLLGHAWTRGPLATVLGFDCAFTLPVAVVFAAPFAVVAWLLLAGGLGARLANRSRPTAS